MHDKCNVLESSRNHHPRPVCGKIVFLETSPWAIKVGGRCLRRNGDKLGVSMRGAWTQPHSPGPVTALSPLPFPLPLQSTARPSDPHRCTPSSFAFAPRASSIASGQLSRAQTLLEVQAKCGRQPSSKGAGMQGMERLASGPAGEF